ncbi:unnamed protein product, partial [Choristocarpus tenellus]
MMSSNMQESEGISKCRVEEALNRASHNTNPETEATRSPTATRAKYLSASGDHSLEAPATPAATTAMVITTTSLGGLDGRHTVETGVVSEAVSLPVTTSEEETEVSTMPAIETGSTTSVVSPIAPSSSALPSPTLEEPVGCHASEVDSEVASLAAVAATVPVAVSTVVKTALTPGLMQSTPGKQPSQDHPPQVDAPPSVVRPRVLIAAPRSAVSASIIVSSSFPTKSAFERAPNQSTPLPAPTPDVSVTQSLHTILGPASSRVATTTTTWPSSTLVRGDSEEQKIQVTSPAFARDPEVEDGAASVLALEMSRTAGVGKVDGDTDSRDRCRVPSVGTGPAPGLPIVPVHGDQAGNNNGGWLSQESLKGGAGQAVIDVKGAVESAAVTVIMGMDKGITSEGGAGVGVGTTSSNGDGPYELPTLTTATAVSDVSSTTGATLGPPRAMERSSEHVQDTVAVGLSTGTSAPVVVEVGVKRSLSSETINKGEGISAAAVPCCSRGQEGDYVVKTVVGGIVEREGGEVSS